MTFSEKCPWDKRKARGHIQNEDLIAIKWSRISRGKKVSVFMNNSQQRTKNTLWLLLCLAWKRLALVLFCHFCKKMNFSLSWWFQIVLIYIFIYLYRSFEICNLNGLYNHLLYTRRKPRLKSYVKEVTDHRYELCFWEYGLRWNECKFLENLTTFAKHCSWTCLSYGFVPSYRFVKYKV